MTPITTVNLKKKKKMIPIKSMTKKHLMILNTLNKTSNPKERELKLQ